MKNVVFIFLFFTMISNAQVVPFAFLSSSLNELTVPDAPTIGLAVAENTRVSIPFTAPANKGGSTIISYTATSSPGNITATVFQAGSGTITVAGLTNGISYTFTVTATNGIGESAASEESNSVVPAETIPDPPTAGIARTGNTEAEIPFKAPTNDGGAVIVSYTATSNPGNISATVYQSESGSIIVSGLTNGIDYNFSIVATNINGTSTASTTINTITPYVVSDVTGSAGRIWMDRNLGASRVAISKTDALAYGDLYQWGRATDGHQKRSSATINALSSTYSPEHTDFVNAPDAPYDWLIEQNDNLWQGKYGINNPCPIGYRVPTFDELDAERRSWSQIANQTVDDAYNSPLKITLAGMRASNGFSNEGVAGLYWTSSINPDRTSKYLQVYQLLGFAGTNRADGLCVRCIKAASDYVNAQVTTNLTAVWDAENLSVSLYNDGTPVKKVSNLSEYEAAVAAKEGVWAYYNFNDQNASYGKYYNNYAIYDVAHEGLVPDGWHIPSAEEINQLGLDIGGVTNAVDLFMGGTNQFNFSALQAYSYRDVWNKDSDGRSYWWAKNALVYGISFAYELETLSSNDTFMLNVRIIKD